MSHLTTNTLPQHIAIIMDGNGRWAERRGYPRAIGHEEGVNAIEKIVKAVMEKKIPVLTLFAFGIENWKRPKDEVNFLMELFAKTLNSQVESFLKNNIKLHVIGDLTPIEPALQKKIRDVEKLTSDNSALTLIIAFNYSGRWDILQATQKIAHKITAGELEPHTISYEHIQSVISLAEFPEPDLFIRSSGEQRISNFLLWQLAYTELYFTEVLWPDFDGQVLEDALQAFSKRQRRYGLTRQQVAEHGAS